MARNMLPMGTGRGIAGKIIAALITVAILALVVQHPGDAASWVVGTVHLAGRVIGGIVAFLRDTLG